jgi:AMP nucleosidase
MLRGPGIYRASLTRPDLFGDYYRAQLAALCRHNSVVLRVGLSDRPIPIHFALAADQHVESTLDPIRLDRIGAFFDLPDLAGMDDALANGTWRSPTNGRQPLALFTASRVDLSLQRLRHYTATDPEHFQSYVIFTNYQFYVDEFVRMGLATMATGATPDAMFATPAQDFSAFVEPGGRITPSTRHAPGAPARGLRADRLPQMPAYHLKRQDGDGITLINIGIGPSNAKTVTDHLAVLRPHAWLMLGHCAGLRETQRLGDYVLAHAYAREDHVLDEALPTWVPIPALAEVQQAIETAIAEVTGLSGPALKGVVRTGTVTSVDDRNWEFKEQAELERRFSLSRAIALDMESATVAANGFRFRVPYGTLLCVSDKPLHGQLKLPGMANAFYRARVDQHLRIGLRALEVLRSGGVERLHSRKLRSYLDTAFR